MTPEAAPDRRPPPVAPLALAPSPDRLREDLGRVVRTEWTRQHVYSAGGHSADSAADWRVLPLRSPGGDAGRTDAGGPGSEPFRDTEWMRRAPHLAELVHGLPASVFSARLMSLAPGARVATHRDTPVGFRYGRLRLHVPLVTNDGAVLVLDGRTYRWQPGTVWYGDFARPHSIANTGTAARVHLVIDCAVTPRLLDLFPPDFTARLPVGEVLFERPRIDLSPADRAGFACRFTVPARFADWSGEPLPGEPTAEGELDARVEDGPTGLTLSMTGRPVMGLEHLGAGEFRLQCWTEERTLQIDPAGRVVHLLIRAGSGLDITERPARPTTA